MHFGGDAYGENIEKGQQVLLEVIGVAATVICTIVTVIQLVRDVAKDKKQKSNRPSPKEQVAFS